jgi:peptidoglycan/LPS O-acetylase OafA/YrhL
MVDNFVLMVGKLMSKLIVYHIGLPFLLYSLLVAFLSFFVAKRWGYKAFFLLVLAPAIVAGFRASWSAPDLWDPFWTLLTALPIFAGVALGLRKRSLISPRRNELQNEVS